MQEFINSNIINVIVLIIVKLCVGKFGSFAFAVVLACVFAAKANVPNVCRQKKLLKMRSVGNCFCPSLLSQNLQVYMSACDCPILHCRFLALAITVACIFSCDFL